MTVKQSIGPAQPYTYIARLFSDDLSEQEALAIREWRMADPANEKEFIKTLLLFDEIGTRSDDIEAISRPESSQHSDAPPLSSSVLQSGHTGTLRLTGRPWLRFAVAASLLVGIALGFEAWQNTFGIFQDNPYSNATLDRFITRVSEQKSLTLQDGSKVTLNTGTEIIVGITDQNRWVRLERGEAFFDIAKDPERPFTVHVNNKAVSVLGTRFNIMKSPGKFTLAVIEGLVAVHREEEELQDNAPFLGDPNNFNNNKTVAQLQLPGQRRIAAGIIAEFDIEKNSVLVHKETDLEKSYDWTSGRLHFEATTFADMIKELNRYTGKKILIEDQSIMGLKIYSVVDIKHIYQALDSFEKTLPIKFIHYHDRIVAISAK